MAHVQRQISVLSLSVLIIASELLCGQVARAGEDHIVKQVVVFREPGRFAGWPANHGIWCWGNEVLVGFSRGYHKNLGEGRHNIDREKPEEFLMARSLDGGETWTAEFPNAKGQLIPQGKALHGTEIPGVPIPSLRKCTAAIDFQNPPCGSTGIGNIQPQAAAEKAGMFRRGFPEENFYVDHVLTGTAVHPACGHLERNMKCP